MYKWVGTRKLEKVQSSGTTSMLRLLFCTQPSGQPVNVPKGVTA